MYICIGLVLFVARYLDVYTGWLKKVSCCHSTTAYFFEPPCMWRLFNNTCRDIFVNNNNRFLINIVYFNTRKLRFLL